MRAVLQRVTKAKVNVDGEIVGEISRGLLALVGLCRDDSAEKLEWMAKKIADVRLFAESADKEFHLSLRDTGFGLLLVPQFTLYGDARKGRRPDFNQALSPAAARPLFERLVELCQKEGGFPVASGRFQAHMLVELENDGPVTIILEC
jgi:D-tyrosyl-tRNA(Tyr) deacylase